MDNLSRTELLSKIQFEQMTPRTRSVLFERLEENNPAPSAKVLSATEFEIARLVGEILVPQNDQPDWRVDLASDLDQRLSQTVGKGWRYDVLPPEIEMYKTGLTKIAAMANERFRRPIKQLTASEQVELIDALAQAEEPVWMPQFFEELLAGFVEAYYSHPLAQAAIGCSSMVDIRE